MIQNSSFITNHIPISSNNIFFLQDSYRHVVNLSYNYVNFLNLRFKSNLGIFNIMSNFDKVFKPRYIKMAHLYTCVQAVFKEQRRGKIRDIRDHWISEKDLDKVSQICGIEKNHSYKKAKKDFFSSKFVSKVVVNNETYYEIVSPNTFGNISFEFVNNMKSFKYLYFKNEAIKSIAAKPLKTGMSEISGVYTEYSIAKLFGMSQSSIHNVLKKMKKTFQYAVASDREIIILRNQGKHMLIDDKNLVFLGSRAIYEEAKYNVRMKNGKTIPISKLKKTSENHLSVNIPSDKLNSKILVETNKLQSLLNGVLKGSDNLVTVFQTEAENRKEAVCNLRKTSIAKGLSGNTFDTVKFIEENSDFRFSTKLFISEPLSKLQQICGREKAKILRRMGVERKSSTPGTIAMWSNTADYLMNQSETAKNYSLAQILSYTI